MRWSCTRIFNGFFVSLQATEKHVRYFTHGCYPQWLGRRRTVRCETFQGKEIEILHSKGFLKRFIILQLQQHLIMLFENDFFVTLFYFFFFLKAVLKDFIILYQLMFFLIFWFYLTYEPCPFSPLAVGRAGNTGGWRPDGPPPVDSAAPGCCWPTYPLHCSHSPSGRDWEWLHGCQCPGTRFVT